MARKTDRKNTDLTDAVASAEDFIARLDEYEQNTQEMREWVRSRWCRGYFAEEITTEFFQRYSTSHGFHAGLSDLAMSFNAERWSPLVGSIVGRFTDELVAARKKSERETWATGLRIFLSLFVSHAAGMAYEVEQQDYRLLEMHTNRRSKTRRRNKDIQEHANWLQTRQSKPIKKKKELYQNIRDHFGFTLTDRRLRDILKSSR
tara:strand:- start:100 stop:711 length:612 start_codon:yes stop_codon:yes gene_type:complete